MYTALIILNFAASIISALAAVCAVIRPSSLSGSKDVSSGEGFYVHMYAARAIPIGLAAGLMPLWLAGRPVAWLLFTAATIQLFDVVIAARKNDRRMTVGATIGATVHLLCGIAIM